MSNITEKYIEDRFAFFTNSEKEIYEFMEENDVHTYVERTRTDQISVMVLRDDPDCGPPNIPVWSIEPNRPLARTVKLNVKGAVKTVAINERFQPARIQVPQGDFKINEDFVLGIGGSAYLLSGNALSTLCQRIDYDGGKTVGGLDKASEIAKRLMTTKATVKAVIKTADGIGKIHAFLSDRYCEKKLSEMEKLIREFRKDQKLGRLEFMSGSYNHRYTRLLYKLPEYEGLLKLDGINMVPYIEITNSDTGNSSYTVSAAWKTQTSHEVFYSSREKFKHNSLKTSDKDIVAMTYAQFEHYVKHLKELKKKPMVIDEKIIDKAIEKVCFEYSPFSKKRLKKAALKKLKELDPEKSTAYDLTEIMCQLPELLEAHLAEKGQTLCDETYFKLRKALANVSTLDIEGA